MKKSLIFYFLLLTIMTWTACGDNAVTEQLMAEQTELEEQATKITTAVERFKGEATQLKQLAAGVADKQVVVLLDQYDDISGSLENMQRWYERSAVTYSSMLESQQAGTLTEEGMKKQTQALQEKAAAMDKKAEMTITELERMRGEIETAVQKAKTTPATPTEEG